MSLSMQPVRPQTKAHELCLQLTALAHRIGPGGKFPTVAQLCSSLEVSPTTLNGALGVLEVQQLISRRRGSGIYVSKELVTPEKTRRIVLICDPAYVAGANHSPFWDLLLAQVRTRAQKGHEELEMHFARMEGVGEPEVGEPETALNAGLVADLKAGRVQGVLGVGLRPATVDWIEAVGVPLVAYAGPGEHTVAHDGSEAAFLAVSALALGGCKRIAFWGSVLPGVPTSRFPRTGAEGKIGDFEDALRRNGRVSDPSLLRLNRHVLSNPDPDAQWGTTTLSQQEQGFQTAMEVFGASRESWPDGVFISDDVMAAGALTALGRLGVEVGRDVQIASHANHGSPVLLGHETSLSLVEFDPREFVERMFALLERLMNGESVEQRAISIAPRLCPRSSFSGTAT